MENKRMEFHGGLFGAILPFLVMVALMVILTATKNNTLKCFWIAGMTALCVSYILAKDKKKFNEVTISALGEPMFGTMVIIYLLAGVLSFMLRDSGLINGLLWLCISLNINAAFLSVATFLISVVISTACGTMGGTISTVTPIMFPLAVQLGCEPALMLGALIGGAMFGDNLSPISDTTIASSGNFHAKIRDVVHSRLKYSIIAGTFSSIMFIIFGLKTTIDGIGNYTPDPESVKTLIMLVIPVVMIIMMYRGSQLVPVLLVCNMLTALLNVVMGFIPLSVMITADSPVVHGIESMTGIVIFTVWIFIQNAFLKESGLFEVLIEKLGNVTKRPAHAELLSMLTVALTAMMTANSTIAIVVAGPVVYHMFKKFNINRHRGANYLDGTACGMASILPWDNSLLIMLGLAMSTGLIPQTYSLFNFFPYCFYSFSLLTVYFICAVTGLFRKPDERNYE